MSLPAPDIKTDLLVAGAGCAGMTAALVAAIQGLKVVLVEKAATIGGTTAYSAGTAWIPLTDHMSCRFDDTADAVATYLDGLIGDAPGAGLRQAFMESGAEAVRLLEENSQVSFVLPDHGPDYRDAPGSVAGGRALVAREYDGRKLGSWFRAIRAPRPGFTVLSRMMVGKRDIDALLAPFGSWANFSHVARILLRHAADRLAFSRGTRLVMGNALAARLLASLLDRGVDIWTSTALVNLEMDGAAARGAVIRMPDGSLRRVRAARGVVLATGGFAQSPQWRRDLIGNEDFGLNVACEDAGGDGLTLARSAGAQVDGPRGRGAAFWMPSSALREKDGSVSLFPHIILDRAKPGLLAIDRRGQRFCNEADSYHDFSMAMPEWNAEPAPGAPAWLICDSAFVRKYGLGFIRPGRLSKRLMRRHDYLVEAPDIPALAAKIGVPAETLGKTLSEHNAAADSGVDRRFGKGTTRLNRQNGDSRHMPNPCIGRIDKPPFHALAVWPATLATSAGVVTDADGRALRADGSAIAGLYAIGNDMRSIMHDSYPGPGTTIGPALVFGYRAAMHAARAEMP